QTGQGPVQDDVHGIIEIGAFGVFFEGKAFNAFKIHRLGHNSLVCSLLFWMCRRQIAFILIEETEKTRIDSVG
ncbi:MAG TPA: hypothetical protein DEP79_01095, partial [Gammaproteobacteria bacterium]|nr:hypothetical protein [Gammaproteobacteria bacterium]